MNTTHTAPVITIDGPSGVGKGTIASRLARHFGFHLLDSGAIYRALALACMAKKESIQEEKLIELAETLNWHCETNPDGTIHYLLDGRDISTDIRSEQCGSKASTLAALPLVRQALLHRQRDFRQPPGLVAEGRDMGTAVFPNAPVKLYLTASTEIRANRRYKQLQHIGKSASIRAVKQEMEQRDQRDSTRSASPLRPASDATVIDTGNLDINTVSAQAIEIVAQSLTGNKPKSV